MSTRSGKRLHNTSNEAIEQTEIEPVIKSERKTRSKRIVEVCDDQGVVLKYKRRQNYVSYPADEELTSTNTLENDTQLKPARALRRNTLKEQNVASEEDTTNHTKNQGRQTRRLKKMSETIVEDSPKRSETVEIISNGKHKDKKNKKKSKKAEELADVVNKENDKKTNKKKNKSRKNKSSSFVEQKDEALEKGDTSTSNASFHSAAGSPVNDHCSPQTEPPSGDTVDNGENHLYDHAGETKRSSLRNKSPNLNSSAKATVNSTFDKDTEIIPDKGSWKKKSSLKNSTFDENNKSQNISQTINTTFEKAPTKELSTNKSKRKSILTDSTIEVIDVPLTRKQSDLDIQKKEGEILNSTFDKYDNTLVTETKKPRKSNFKERILEIFSFNTSHNTQVIDESNEKSASPAKSLNISQKKPSLNETFEKSPKPDGTKQKSLDTTFDKEIKINTTFDKESKLDSTFDKTDTNRQQSRSKSSLLTSDTDSNITLDKSKEISTISITDDDSKTENILNATPMMIESSIEVSNISESSSKENQTPESKPPVLTPLKREGTFTKEESEVSMSPKQTPNKRQTLPAAGCTPYRSDRKGSQKKKSVLNLTHSVEKPERRSPLAEAPRAMAEAPRAPRVMFCSPGDNPTLASQRKSKIIKSNLKGSNKSFVFEESESVSRAGRKRSFTQTDAEEARAKRSRLAVPRPALRPALRTPRARTASATAKLSTASPQKSATPLKPKSDVKATKLPNFAALHARRFERMESLDECQERRARRARQLMEPAGSLAVLERSSPRVTIEPVRTKDSPLKPTPLKSATPAKPVPKLPTLDTLQRGYTRFGFKMNCDVNPFSCPAKPAEKPKEIKPKVVPTVLKRRAAQPSLVGAVGATSHRRVAAQKTIMREKSFTLSEKRDENRKESRTIIKGVRTNRRFELQMRSRNINA